MRTMVARYAALLRTPGAGPLVALGLTARLSTAVVSLPLILLGADAAGSYAGGGAATAGFGAGVALAAPWRGRLIDTHGARRTLPWLLAVHALALVAIAAGGSAGVAAVTIAAAAVCGAAVPSLPAAMRLEWQRLLGQRDPRLDLAYTFETTAQVSLFVVGPVLAAAGVATIGAAWTLVACAALVTVPGLAFARLVRRPGAGRAAAGRGLGPIRLPGVRALVIAVLLADLSLGAIEVGVVAFADERGREALAGVLLAGYAVSSALGAFAIGATSWSGRLADPAWRLLGLLVLSTLGAAPLALAGSLPVLGLLLLVGGIPYAAQFATAAIVLDRVTPPAAAAEAYNWISAANSAGVALGALAGGVLVDAVAPWAALASGAAAIGVAAAWVALRRGRLSACAG